MSIKNSPARKEQRRQGAATRTADRATRTPQQQLDRLDGMFGKDRGAHKERARLLKQLGKAV